MVVGEHRIPDALVRAIRSGRLERSIGSWELRENRDCDGRPLETELSEVYRTAAQMARASAELVEDFVADGCYGNPDDVVDPKSIPDILDFRDIVCFGEAGDGSPFCLDYRESRTRPRVIWWDDAYWRVVAPDIESFLSLFVLDEGV